MADKTGKTVAVIQARMGSQRFFGKSLARLHHQPLLAWAVDRAQGATRIDQVVVATTREPLDDPLAAWCRRAGIPVVRGATQDVLRRCVEAARAYEADFVVRLTADNPLIPSQLIDDVVAPCHEDSTVDYCSSHEPPTFPEGWSAECTPMHILERLDREVTSVFEREHVMLHARIRPEVFRHVSVEVDPPLSHIRLTVDYPDDLAGLEQIAVELERVGELHNPSFERLVEIWNAKESVRELMSRHERDAWRGEAERQKRRSA